MTLSRNLSLSHIPHLNYYNYVEKYSLRGSGCIVFSVVVFPIGNFKKQVLCLLTCILDLKCSWEISPPTNFGLAFISGGFGQCGGSGAINREPEMLVCGIILMSIINLVNYLNEQRTCAGPKSSLLGKQSECHTSIVYKTSSNITHVHLHSTLLLTPQCLHLLVYA